jgi:tetratricopeptide (TPR) repeat protein
MGLSLPDALAVILGHELAHFYYNHGWVADYGIAIPKLPGMTKEEHVRIESFADIWGGFTGVMAGYNVASLMPKVIEGIYNDYHLPGSINGYLDLQDRKKLAEEAQHELEKLIPIFNAAERLLVLQEYHLARRLFEYIAGKFTSREILNNAGVALLYEAFNLITDDDVKMFAYPFEVDARTRLDSTKEQLFSSQLLPEIDKLLGRAERYFNDAIRKDSEYGPAYINLACVHLLKGETEEAVMVVKKVNTQVQNDDNSMANAMIVRGIAKAMNRDYSQAIRDFEEAEKTNNSLIAALNKSYLSVQNLVDKTLTVTKKETQLKESIGNQTIVQIMQKPFIPILELQSDSFLKDQHVELSVREEGEWQGLYIQLSNETITIVSTKPNYKLRSLSDVSVGMASDVLYRQYGTPSRILASRQGDYAVYENRGITFLNTKGLVTGWFIFAKQTRAGNTTFER